MSNATGAPASDGFDFIKKMWGGFSLPASMTPTADIEEMDKRIKDLKAVEQWLNVNMSMLRATIQGLEVQRDTIAMFKSKSAMDTSLKVGEATDQFLSNASAWWGALQDQFNSAAQTAQTAQAEPAAAPVKTEADKTVAKNTKPAKPKAPK